MLQPAVLLAALQGRTAARPLSMAEACAVLGWDAGLRRSVNAVCGVVSNLRVRGVRVAGRRGAGYWLAEPCAVLPPWPCRTVRAADAGAPRPREGDGSEAGRLRRLWQAVLARAIEDAAGRVGALDDPDERGQCQRAAAAWVGRRDFGTVCHLAGLDPDAVRDRLRRAGVDAVAQRLAGVAA